MEEASVDQQVDDLRERMRLLQGDRRANVEIIQANKDANKEEIKRLRDDNKELRVKIAQLQRAKDGVEGGAEGDSDALRNGVVKMRKQYDQCKMITTKNKKELQGLKDEVKELELEARRPNQEDSPLTRSIRMLENRLDKAMIKYNEAQSIRKTYEQIVKRLKEERIGFDNQLAALERTYAAKQRDYEELLLLSGDANHAREVAQQELERVRGGYEEERKRREKESRERHQELALRRQMQDLISKRNKMRQEIIAQEAGDLGAEGEETLKKAMAVNVMTSQRVTQERLEQKTKIDIFENAFRKIKEATGVSDVNEVIQKIISQEGTTENLMLLTKENQAKIEALNDTKGAMKARVEEIKYSGPGGGHRRKMVDDHEEQLTSSATRLERCRLKYERLAKMLISVKAGIKHLQDKLQPVVDEVGGRAIELTDETVVGVLLENEKVVLSLVNRMKAAKAEEQALFDVALDDPEHDDEIMKLGATSTVEEVDEGILQSRPHNQRIELPNADEDWEGEAGGKADDGIPEPDEEELTRDKVKKASQQLMSQQEKKKVKRRRRED